MSVPILTFFNNKGGVGKTSLIYHLSWMYANLNKRVIAVDLDPQANLTAAFLDEEQIENIWNENAAGTTIYQAVKPLTGVGDIIEPCLIDISKNLYLLPGDVQLSAYEDELSDQWSRSMNDKNLYRPMRMLSSFWNVMEMAAKKSNADIILVDIGPNLGAINRSALIATDYVIIPLGADLFSLQGLRNLGPTMKNWRNLWKKRLENWEYSMDHNYYPDFRLPEGKMEIIGYLCQQYGVRLEKPVKAYDRWINRIPTVYRESVLEIQDSMVSSPSVDPYCLGTIKHYRSLVPMAQESRKPIFNLTAADGAIGGHATAAQDAKKDFINLAKKIGTKIGADI